METEATPANRRHLPIILACAVVQGLSLYALHYAINAEHWPASDPGWLLALFAIAIFIPITVQLLADYACKRSLWIIVTALAAAFFYFGYHDGARAFHGEASTAAGERLPPLLFVMLLVWLQVMPFVQGRLLTGRWRFEYCVLFTMAWRNKLVLAEATLFTGLFWLLLFLWQALFAALGIEFFKELFQEPIFVYPVTSLTFGIALHLIGSVERLTLAILEQLLNVLKWLSLVGGVILVCFTVAMLFSMPELLGRGEQFIGATWLLWLVAVMVLMLNAAYRDGSDARPYPAWIGFGLRLVVPLTVVVSLVAIYAIVLRARQYGLTVERVWAFVVAGSAFVYSAGYSWAALASGRWMQGMGRVNVVTSLALMATISLMLTPVLSPYRLAAESQYRQALLGPPPEAGRNFRGVSPVAYLRHGAGAYGMGSLQRLTTLDNHPDANRIREWATAALGSGDSWEATLADAADRVLRNLVIYPAGYGIETSLMARLTEELRSTRFVPFLLSGGQSDVKGIGIYVDLNGDAIEEFLLLLPSAGKLYEKSQGQWGPAHDLVMPATGSAQWNDLLRDVNAGKIATAAPRWNRLMIGEYSLRVSEGATRTNPRIDEEQVE